MTENKPWKSFLIVGLRHKHDFDVVKKILERLGYKFDGELIVEAKDYTGSLVTLPGKTLSNGFSVISTNDELNETDEELTGRPMDWRKVLPAIRLPEKILTIMELLDYYNKSHFD